MVVVGGDIVVDADAGAVRRTSLLFRLARAGVGLFARSGETGLSLLGGGSVTAVGVVSGVAVSSRKNSSVVAWW